MVIRRASDKEVLEASHRVLARQPYVQTQARMGRLVREELERAGVEGTVAPARVRALVAAAPFARVEIRARPGPREKVLHRCPVCGGKLEKVRNQTLFGGEVTLVMRCERCAYWTDKAKRVPTLYQFHLKD